MAYNFNNPWAKNPWAENIWAKPEMTDKVLGNGEKESFEGKYIFIIGFGDEFYGDESPGDFKEYKKIFIAKGYPSKNIFTLDCGRAILNKLIEISCSMPIKNLIFLSHGAERLGIVGYSPNTGIYSSYFLGINKLSNYAYDSSFEYIDKDKGISLEELSNCREKNLIRFDNNALIVLGGCSLFTYCRVIDYDKEMIDKDKKNDTQEYWLTKKYISPLKTLSPDSAWEYLYVYREINFASELGESLQVSVVGSGSREVY